MLAFTACSRGFEHMVKVVTQIDIYTLTHSLASVTCEALRVVGVAEGSDNTPLNEVTTCFAFCSKENMIVFAAVVLILLHEVATRCQLTATH